MNLLLFGKIVLNPKYPFDLNQSYKFVSHTYQYTLFEPNHLSNTRPPLYSSPYINSMQALRQFQEFFKPLEQISIVLRQIASFNHSVRPIHDTQQQTQGIIDVMLKYSQLFKEQFIPNLTKAIEKFQLTNISGFLRKKPKISVHQQYNSFADEQILSKLKNYIELDETPVNQSETSQVIQSHSADLFSSYQGQNRLQHMHHQNSNQKRQNKEELFSVLGQIDLYDKNKYFGPPQNSVSLRPLKKRQLQIQSKVFSFATRGVCNQNGKSIERTQKQVQTQKISFKFDQKQDKKAKNRSEHQKDEKKNGRVRKSILKDEYQQKLQSIIYGPELVNFVNQFTARHIQPLDYKQQQIKLPIKSYRQEVNKSPMIKFFIKSKDVITQKQLIQTTFQRLILIFLDTILCVLKQMEFYLPQGILAQILLQIRENQILSFNSEPMSLRNNNLESLCKQIVKKMKQIKKMNQRPRVFINITDKLNLHIKQTQQRK